MKTHVACAFMGSWINQYVQKQISVLVWNMAHKITTCYGSEKSESEALNHIRSDSRTKLTMATTFWTLLFWVQNVVATIMYYITVKVPILSFTLA